MTKHSPGPWKVIPPDSDHPSRVMVGAVPQPAGAGYGVTIYDAPLTTETEANARLIAAAPTMYQALSDIEALADRETHLKTGAKIDMSELLPDILKVARTTITKATK